MFVLEDRDKKLQQGLVDFDPSTARATECVKSVTMGELGAIVPHVEIYVVERTSKQGYEFRSPEHPHLYVVPSAGTSQSTRELS
jgi:hypothetical protein